MTCSLGPAGPTEDEAHALWDRTMAIPLGELFSAPELAGQKIVIRLEMRPVDPDAERPSSARLISLQELGGLKGPTAARDYLRKCIEVDLRRLCLSACLGKDGLAEYDLAMKF